MSFTVSKRKEGALGKKKNVNLRPHPTPDKAKNKKRDLTTAPNFHLS